MERDFIGYGPEPPVANWPGRARIAVSLVVNYEEGSENSYAFGDPVQETYKEYPKALPPGVRDLTNEQNYEYGSRVAIWRLLRLFEKYQVPVTFYACALALERNPLAVRAVVAAGHEICSHGYRWQEQFTMTEAEEREFIRKAVESFERTAGVRPKGWYCRYGPSIHTRRLLQEAGGFLYDSDSVNDDLPYYVMSEGKPFLVVPYTVELNDMKFWTTSAYGNPGDFFTCLKDNFDMLYEEGATHPKMMTVALHLRISGRPGRARAVEDFIRYARSFPGVWFARREDIAQWWLNNYPPQ